MSRLLKLHDKRLRCHDCDEQLEPGDMVRIYHPKGFDNGPMHVFHQACADKECRCPQCGEPVDIVIEDEFKGVAELDAEPADWNEALTCGDPIGEGDFLFKHASLNDSAWRCEVWRCRYCGFVFYEDVKG